MYRWMSKWAVRKPGLKKCIGHEKMIWPKLDHCQFATILQYSGDLNIRLVRHFNCRRLSDHRKVHYSNSNLNSRPFYSIIWMVIWIAYNLSSILMPGKQRELDIWILDYKKSVIQMSPLFKCWSFRSSL